VTALSAIAALQQKNVLNNPNHIFIFFLLENSLRNNWLIPDAPTVNNSRRELL
jgi:hypothetical protein